MPKRLSGARAIDRAIKKALKPKKVKEPKQPKPKTPKPKKTRTKKEPTEAELRAKRQKEQQKRIAKIARDYGREVRQKAIAEKKAAREAARAARQKEITERKAAREALRKERSSVYYKRKKQIERYGKKALDLNRATQDTVDSYRMNGLKVDNLQQLQTVKERVEQILGKDKPTDQDVELIKEYSRRNTYDYIKVTLPIQHKETKDNEDGSQIEITSDTEFNFKDIRLALQKQISSPEKLTALQQQLVAEYGKNVAYNKIDYADIPDINVNDKMTDEEIDKLIENKINEFKKRHQSINHDVSIGGNSELINKLSYTYDCAPTGTQFVERLQRLMSDTKTFILLESWFRSPKADEVKDDIEEATGHNWYSHFKSFSVAILKAADSLSGLSDKVAAIFNDDNFRDILEQAADEEITGDI